MSQPAVLVTGGAGYIGSHACKVLAAGGYLPVAFDNLVHGNAAAVQWGPLEVGDITDQAQLQDAMRRHQCVAVIHFAAFAYVGESVEQPGKYYQNNVLGTLSLLEAMRSCGVGNLVFSSSCATYGIPDSVPIGEDSRQLPINPYGETKFVCERMIAAFGRAHGLRYALLRYFNAAGADADGQIGECHDPETHLIPLALRAAAGSGKLTVHGNDYPTPDGTCVRDYIHVTDLGAAHVEALTALLNGMEPTALNLGTGEGVSIQGVIEAVSRVTGKQVPFTVGPRRPGDPPVLIADPSRARTSLGWSAKQSDIDTIISTAWAWHQRAPA